MLKFYMAAGRDDRQYAESLSQHLVAAAATQPRACQWYCTSRWLAGEVQGSSLSDRAKRNLEDVRAADFLILHHGSTTRGGKWVELGMAIALETPAMVIIDQIGGRRPDGPPHAVWGPTVSVATFVDHETALVTHGDHMCPWDEDRWDRVRYVFGKHSMEWDKRT